MYKIIYTTAEDFVKQEIEEHGYDYVEAKFSMGYEPTLHKDGFYVWSRITRTDNGSSNGSNCMLPTSQFMVSSV